MKKENKVWIVNVDGGKQINPKDLKKRKPVSKNWKIATWVLMSLFLLLVVGGIILSILS